MKIFNNSTNPNPTYGTQDSAGLDLAAKDDILLYAHERILVTTGIHVEIPKNHVGLLFPRSSLSKKHLFLTNSVGVIDSDYRGDIMVSLLYSPPDSYHPRVMQVNRGERIVQLVIMPYVKVVLQEVNSPTKLDSTERGQGGFGSTGT